jgi:hypothetical protein
MTTSGTTTYNSVRDTIIRRSLRMVGAYAADGNPTAAQINDANDVLNIMLKDWQIDGFLWLRVFGTLFLNKGQRQYSLAPSTYSGFAHCAVAANPGDTPYVQTVTTVAAIVGASSVTVSSATGISNASYVGVANDNGIIEWFYASVAGLVVSLKTDVALTTPGALGVAAAKGNVVYSHSVASQANRPTRITSSVRKLYDTTAANGYEIPLEPPGGISRSDYERLPNKTTIGKIISIYYDPQMVAGQLFVWPTADTPGDKLILTMDRPIQDMVTDSNTFDVPQEALRSIADLLAYEIEPEYPLEGVAFQKLKDRALNAKTRLMNYNRENVGTSFQPDMGR